MKQGARRYLRLLPLLPLLAAPTAAGAHESRNRLEGLQPGSTS